MLRSAWLVAVFVALFLAFLPIEKMITLFGIGDALVYVRVAFNIAVGRGSTYSLLNDTNGYHPLWLLPQIPFYLGAQDMISRMAWAQKLWALCALVNALAWSRWVWSVTRHAAAAALAALLFSAFGWSLYVLYSGIETPLALLLLCMVVRGVCRLLGAERPGFKPLLSLAAWCALAFLARLDSFFVILPLLALAWRPLLAFPRRQLLAAAALGVAIPAPYLVWNLRHFGKLLPVSGFVKTAPHFGLANARMVLGTWLRRMAAIGVPGSVLLLVALGALAVAVWLILRVGRRQPLFARVTLAVLAGAVMQYAYYLFCMTEINVPWHLYPQVLTVYLMLTGLLMLAIPFAGRFWLGRPERLPRAVFLVFVAALGLATGFYARAKLVRTVETRAAFTIGRMAAHSLPRDARVAMHDSFVTGAFLPNMALVDTNGLVEDLDGAKIIKQQGTLALIKARHCDYWIQHQRGPAAGETLPGDALIEIPYSEPKIDGKFILWRLKK